MPKRTPRCPIHQTKLICPACIGATTSIAKAEASARNGRLGGRPPSHLSACQHRETGRYTPNCRGCEYLRSRA